MGQIIASAAKPKRCNLSKLSQLGTPAAGEYILVSSDNSMNAAGQGNFDYYIVGVGTTAATELPLKSIDGVTKDEIEQSLSFATSGAGSERFDFFAGETYILSNNGSNTVTFSTRKTENGSAIDGNWTLTAGTSKEITITQRAYYLRHGAAATGTIVRKNTIMWRLDALEEEGKTLEYLNVRVGVDDVSFTLASAGSYPYNFLKDVTYTIVNNGSARVGISTRIVADDISTQVDGLYYVEIGGSYTFKASGDAYYLRCGTGCSLTIVVSNSIEKQLESIEDVINGVSKLGDLYTGFRLHPSDGTWYNDDYGSYYVIPINGGSLCKLTSSSIAGQYTFLKTFSPPSADGQSVDYATGYTIPVQMTANTTTSVYAPSDAAYLWVLVSRNVSGTKTNCFMKSIIIDGEDYINISIEDRMSVLQNLIKEQREYQFETDFDLSRVPIYTFNDSDSMGTNDLYSLIFGNDISTLYAKYDELMASYPQYITKVDCKSEFNAASGLTTPTYMSSLPVYMYKFTPVRAVSNVNTDVGSRIKVFLTSNHPNERPGLWTLYYTLKHICENWKTDENARMLRGLIDIYIIPTVWPWNYNEVSRTNYNGVNPNRNFPTEQWTESGQGTYNWTGSSAASEYETQMMVYYINQIKPDVCMDVHTSGNDDFGHMGIFIVNQIDQKIVDLTGVIARTTSDRIIIDDTTGNYPTEPNNSLYGVYPETDASQRGEFYQYVYEQGCNYSVLQEESYYSKWSNGTFLGTSASIVKQYTNAILRGNVQYAFNAILRLVYAFTRSFYVSEG